ncbi:putative tick transposon [Operophtera brumata]|uniref:Putative tick transposon n=1 Tax=Operophtera brumata TaxID=104452 RepID=A0A0L7LLS0_OPEBR|nr:putative tick transposon [Operophtera brumata]
MFSLQKCSIKKNDSSWITPDVQNYKLFLFDIIEFSKLVPNNDIILSQISDMTKIIITQQTVHGGSCIFVTDRIKCIENVDLTSLSVERKCEISAIDLLELDMTIVCIYRTNLVSFSDFICAFERLLDKISFLGIECILMGDFNVNCLINLYSDVKKLTDLLSAHGLSNLVDFPTRTNTVSSTSLDHLYTNLVAGTVSVSPVITNISDHIAIKGEVTRARILPHTKYTYTRKFNNINKANFVVSVDSVDWTEILQKKNQTFDMLNSIINVIKNKFEICFPTQKCSIKKNDSSWITPDVQNYKLFLFDIIEFSKLVPNNDIILSQISDMTNYYNVLINRTKREYYETIIGASRMTLLEVDCRGTTAADGRLAHFTDEDPQLRTDGWLTLLTRNHSRGRTAGSLY